MQSVHASAEFLAWAEQEGIDLSMLYERLQLTPTERLQRHQMALALVETLLPACPIVDRVQVDRKTQMPP